MASNTKQTKISSFFRTNIVNTEDCVDAQAGPDVDPAAKLQPRPPNDVSMIESVSADDATTERRVENTKIEAMPNFTAEIRIIENSGAPSPATEHPEAHAIEDDPGDFVIEAPQDTSFSLESNATTLPDASKVATFQFQDPRYTIQRISSTDLTPFKRLLNTLLPVNYSSSFFSNIQKTNSAFSRIAKWHHRPGLAGLLVGGIKCRLEPVPPLPGPDGLPVKESQLYIQAIGVLAPYRRFGVANALLEEILAEVRDPGSDHLEVIGKTCSVCAHVWQASPDALEWYQKRGFVVEEVVEEYYTRLKPHGAWLVRKQLL